ncbi:hypothetical protein ACFL6Y_06190 [Elusimicrobiota bacterium]
MKQLQCRIPLTDLIDRLAIAQIKEVLLPRRKRAKFSKEIECLAHDIDITLGKRSAKLSAQALWLIICMAQANLHIWFNKDLMQEGSKKYYELLEFAQSLNNMRNHAKNLLMKGFSEAEPCAQKAIFQDNKLDRGFAPVIRAMTGSGTRKGYRSKRAKR